MPNRLARERSPYLLQHANNPVDWFPWGDEAFAAARARGQADLSLDRLLDVPLVPRDGARVVRGRRRSPPCSIAISSPIKVDREERPDVDRVYMTFVQATTGAGGWPMSVWLTPDLEPFFGGTYFPPSVAVGPAGIRRRADAARARLARRTRRVVLQSADDIVERLREATRRGRGRAGSRRPWPAARRSTPASRRSRRRSTAGTAGSAARPKFPRPSELLFLLDAYALTGDDAREAHGARDAARDGARRHARSRRRRIPPLLGRRASGACRTSRRCSTTRRSSSLAYLEALR